MNKTKTFYKLKPQIQAIISILFIMKMLHVKDIYYKILYFHLYLSDYAQRLHYHLTKGHFLISLLIFNFNHKTYYQNINILTSHDI